MERENLSYEILGFDSQVQSHAMEFQIEFSSSGIRKNISFFPFIQNCKKVSQSFQVSTWRW